MLKGQWLDRLETTRKNFFTLFIVLFNSFTWHYITLSFIERASNALEVTNKEKLAVPVIYYAAVIGSYIAGSIPSRIRKRSFLYLWMILGAISSLLPLQPSITACTWSFILGASFGWGMPLSFAYFADYSTTENRGRISGIITLATFLSAPFIIITFSMFDLKAGFILLAMWRGIGLISLRLLKPAETVVVEKRKDFSFMEIVQDKSFILYLVPWIMFVLIDRFEGPILWNLLSDTSLGFVTFVEPIIGSFSAFFGGLLSDRMGRKRVVIGAFVALGLAYAAIGIAPNMLISWYFYAALDGVAWGILMVTFILTLWGDLSPSNAREKYYVVGNTPLYLASIVQSLFASYVALIPASATFSLASFFLFVAVLPLMYAPETLPEKKIELRRLRGYVEQAKKVRDRYPKKAGT